MWLRRVTTFASPTVRLRLTLTYAALFLVSGALLLAITYELEARNLPQAPPPSAAAAAAADPAFRTLCNKAANSPVEDPKLIARCQDAFSRGVSVGATVGAADQRRQALHQLLLYSSAGLAAMTIVSGFVGWIVAGRVLGPVRAVTEAARRASEQHLGERLSLGGPDDELKELGNTFDDMLDRLDAAFASQRRFVDNASHELRTPLTVMRAAIDVTLAKPSRTPAQLESMATDVRASIEEAEALIDALLTLARSERTVAPRESFDLSTATTAALEAARPAIEAGGIEVHAAVEPARTQGDRILLQRLVANLVDNAVQHNQQGGWLRVTSGERSQAACLVVANSGPSIDPGIVDSLFEPFWRLEGRTAASGSVGLGLSIVRAVARAHGGQVVAESLPGGGLQVAVTLPGVYSSPHAIA